MANEAFGISLSFQSGYLAEVIGVNHTGLKRNVYDKTSNANYSSTSGWREKFFSKMKDPGQLKVKIRARAGQTPPLHTAAETVTVTFPVQPGETTPDTFSCTGGMTEFEQTGEMEGLIEADVTLDLSGTPTWTKGS